MVSKGKVLRRVVITLKVEIISFLDTEEHNLTFDYLSDIWWLQVSFLTDLFEKLNELNKKLQGNDDNLITSTGKISSFSNKLKCKTPIQ